MCYKTIYGYLGGIHIAIMLCRLKHLYSGSPLYILQMFFNYYAETLGTEVITLKSTIEESPETQSPLVILTPAKLVMNSACNVTFSTLRHIQSQFSYIKDQLFLITRGISVSTGCYLIKLACEFHW